MEKIVYPESERYFVTFALSDTVMNYLSSTYHLIRANADSVLFLIDPLRTNRSLSRNHYTVMEFKFRPNPSSCGPHG